MPVGVYIRTEEHKQNLSKAMKKKGIVPPPQWGNKYRLGKKHTEVARKKISKAITGRKLSGEHKQKLKEIARQRARENEDFGFKKGNDVGPRFKEGNIPWNKGRSFLALEENPNWRGGISFEPYSTEWTRELKERIRDRDGHICQMCGARGKHVHHVDYDKKNCDSKNLVTLCNSCHSKTNFNREYWVEYFQNQHAI